jgi:hypothetical protein
MLYFANGEMMRNKINPKKWVLTPISFFENLDKMVSCGIGVFYDSGMVKTLELRPIADFYSSTIGLVVDIDFDDLTIEVDNSRIYNKIEVGYSTFKDSPEELHGLNSYAVTEQTKGSTAWVKITDFIASKFVIKKALSLGTDDKELEFDKNTFVLHGNDDGTHHIHTYSQNDNNTALGYDDTYEDDRVQVFGMNRHFATLFNLIRHKLRWKFGMYKVKTLMDNNNLSIKTVMGDAWTPDCDIPQSVYFNAKKSVDYTDLDPTDTYSRIPQTLSFKLVMTIIEFNELKKDWYKTVQIDTENGSYYGNILSAEYQNGIVNFKLLS